MLAAPLWIEEYFDTCIGFIKDSPLLHTQHKRAQEHMFSSHPTQLQHLQSFLVNTHKPCLI